jgi:hypothetical protein
VSQRATTSLIRELELAGPGELFSEAVHMQYSDMFQGPLAAKSIAVLRAATHLGDADVSKEASMFDVDELPAQVETAATLCCHFGWGLRLLVPFPCRLVLMCF